MKNVTTIYFKIILFSVLLIFSSFKTLQNEIYPEQIDWDTHFKGQPDKHSAFAAETATTWHYSYSSTVRDNHLQIDFKFSAGVVPEKSWVKPERISDRRVSRQLLNHEQGHVYINFLLLKEGEIQIRNQKYAPNNYKRLIQSTANKVSDYYSNLQNRYDDETKHGSDLEAQSRWDDYIRSEMNKYQ